MFRKLAWAIVVVCASSAFAANVGVRRDHPLFKRPSGYEIVEYDVGERALALPRERFGAMPLAGRLTEIFYRTEGQPLSSSALGVRFIASLQKAGGDVVYAENPGMGGRTIVGRLVREGRDVWVMQEAVSLREYHLAILETPVDRVYNTPAAHPINDETEAQVLDLLHTVDRTGRLEFPARFPHGSSVLSKGYEADFEKCVMLMDKDPSLKFRVETYTDADLKPAEQRTLLRDRLAGLVDTLIGMGVDKGRLTTEVPPGEATTVPQGVVRLTAVDSVDPVNSTTP
jgi:hypothetical protein